uniref:Retrotransposon gag domain-containing protein n=1 Tax=Lactuca sativa TaxID=4236 RepID=A0A9R1VSZ0_LACSA|nr:hypothetical protein LSAT_V11C400226600 [Lactuca sativa]
MDHGKAIVDGGVSVEGTSGLLPHEKLKAELELSELEGNLEPTTPLSLSERDEEDEDVESEVEPEEDPEEEPEEDPEEEPEEDSEEESEGNHVEYHAEQRYETFHMPYVEYTPSSPGTYWERLYKDEMPQAQLEIHSLKRKIEEIDEHRSRLVQENQIRVDAVMKSKRKIRRLEQEVSELRKPTITKLWEGFVAWAKQAKATTYELLDKVVGREPPQAEVLVIQSGPGDRKAKKIRNREPSIAQPTRHHGNHDRRGCSYKTFMNCKPPIFNGEIDPVLSSTWIMEIEGTFDTSKCADEDKVIYAATMLKGEAIHWWGMVKEVRGREAAKNMSWDDFLRIFKENFCPRTTIK